VGSWPSSQQISRLGSTLIVFGVLSGTGTTAAALTTAVYHLVKQPELWKRLQAALSSALGSNKQPDITELEKIPLLEACAKEALRLSVPIRGRHPRVVPAGGWQYRGYSIPQGVRLTIFHPMHCEVTSMSNLVLY
jgi:cytochrome P450